MKVTILTAILSAAVFAAPLCSAADRAPIAAPAAAPIAPNNLQAMYKAVQTDKKAYVASVLNLTPAEAKKFWPIYDQYQRELDMFNRRRNVALEGLIGTEKSVSDLYAKQLARELIAADEGEVKARRALTNKLIQIKLTSPVPAKKAAQYLQLESQIRAVQNYNVAEQFPLIK